MKRAVILSVLTMVAVTLPLGGVVAPADAANPYKTYVACGTSASDPPSHSCDINGDMAAFFKSKHKDVKYKVCVKFPNGQKLCAKHQDGSKGVLRVNTITSGNTGTHKVSWFVKGEKIGHWNFEGTA